MRGVEIVDSPSFYEQLTGKLLLEYIQPSWFIYSSGFRITPFHHAWKRVMDILHSIVGLLLFLPALAGGCAAHQAVFTGARFLQAATSRREGA